MNKKKKNKKKSYRAFTLIELLAVIIILGVIMLLAIPSVTKITSDSRKKSYILTAKNYIGGAKTLVNEGNEDIYDLDTTYYIPTSCISVESGGDSPYGEFSPAYVIVSYNGNGFDYYWASTDTAQVGILHANEKNLNETLIKTGVDTIDTTIAMAPDSRVKVMDPETCTFGETQAATSFSIPSDKVASEKYNIQLRPTSYNFRDKYTYIRNENGVLKSKSIAPEYDSLWNGFNGRTIQTFILYNDSNLKRFAEVNIQMPKIINNETGEEVEIERWYYEMLVEANDTEIWICTGTGNDNHAECTPKEDYNATSFNTPIANHRFRYRMNFYLKDGNFVNITTNKVAYGYYVYRMYSYYFPTIFMYGSLAE